MSDIAETLGLSLEGIAAHNIAKLHRRHPARLHGRDQHGAAGTRSTMRKHPKTDLNQPELVRTARQIGASVHITAALGCGFPDLVIGYRGVTYLVEVKRPGEGLTDDEREFFLTWRGRAPEVARTREDLFRILGCDWDN